MTPITQPEINSHIDQAIAILRVFNQDIQPTNLYRHLRGRYEMKLRTWEGTRLQASLFAAMEELRIMHGDHIASYS